MNKLTVPAIERLEERVRCLEEVVVKLADLIMATQHYEADALKAVREFLTSEPEPEVNTGEQP